MLGDAALSPPGSGRGFPPDHGVDRPECSAGVDVLVLAGESEVVGAEPDGVARVPGAVLAGHYAAIVHLRVVGRAEGHEGETAAAGIWHIADRQPAHVAVRWHHGSIFLGLDASREAFTSADRTTGPASHLLAGAWDGGGLPVPSNARPGRRPAGP